MKNLILTIIGVVLTAAVATTDERPVTYEQLPTPAKTYIESNFNGEKVTLATREDDLFLPDYTVLLADGTKLEFTNSGKLKQVSSKNGISSDLIPVTIRDYVSAHYPDAGYLDFEIGRKTYEVKLTNRMELKFNRNFHVIEIDY